MVGKFVSNMNNAFIAVHANSTFPQSPNTPRSTIIYLQKQVTVSSTSSGSDNCVAAVPLRCCTARPGTWWRDVEDDACRNKEPGNVAVAALATPPPEDGVCGTESDVSEAKGTAE